MRIVYEPSPVWSHSRRSVLFLERSSLYARPREQVCEAQAKEQQLDGVASWQTKNNENLRNLSQSALLASTWSP